MTTFTRFLVATTTAGTLTINTKRTHHKLSLFLNTSLLMVATMEHCNVSYAAQDMVRAKTMQKPTTHFGKRTIR